MGGPLQKINLHYFASMRISVSDKFRSATARNALYYVEHYLNGLIDQWNRIADDMEGTLRLQRESDLKVDRMAASAFSQLADRTDFDVHFFLTCWDMLDKFLTLFEREQADPSISAILGEVSGLLQKAVRARGYFEHLDERIMRGAGQTRARSAGGGASLAISYEEELGPGSTEVKTEAFGREEIRRIALAYNRILEHLGATIQRSLLGVEVVAPEERLPDRFP